MDELRIQDYEAGISSRPEATGFVVYSGETREIREASNSLHYLWLSIVTTIQKWMGSTVEDYSEVRVIARAKEEFNALREALRSGDRERALAALERCRALSQIEMDGLSRLGRVYQIGNGRISDQLTTLAYRTQDVADILFGAVIRREASDLLRQGDFWENVPQEAKLRTVYAKLLDTEVEAVVNGSSDPIAVGVAYLLQTEGRAGELVQGLRTINLKQEFRAYLERAYGESPIGRMVAEAKETFAKYKRIKGEYDRAGEDTKSDLLRQLEAVSATLEVQAKELATRCPSSQLAQELGRVEGGLSGLSTPVILGAWNEAKAEIVAEHQTLQTELSELIVAIKKENERIEAECQGLKGKLVGLRASQKRESFKEALAQVPQASSTWAYAASFLPFATALAPRLEDRFQALLDGLDGGVITEPLIQHAKALYPDILAGIKSLKMEEYLQELREQETQLDKEVSAAAHVDVNEPGWREALSKFTALDNDLKAVRGEIARCEKMHVREIALLEELSQWLEDVEETASSVESSGQVQNIFRFATAHIDAYHRSLEAVSKLFDPALGG